jgi:hypothetical protein
MKQEVAMTEQDKQAWADAFMEDVKVFMKDHGLPHQGKCGIGPTTLPSVADTGHLAIFADLPFSGFFGCATFSSQPMNGRRKSGRCNAPERLDRPDSLREQKP